MARKSRIDTPGALHHLIVRGIERRAIFKHARDYEDFLTRLGNVLRETSTPCYAWVLMTNHVHLLLRTGLTSISTVMRRLLTGYAQQFNRRHRRHGHLFQNRYRSILCEEEPYLLELVRYIHLNPIRAKIVKDVEALGSSSRCGHSVLMGKIKHDWQDAGYVLRRFGKTGRESRKNYASFMEEGVAQGHRPDLVGGGLVRSVGGWSALKALRSFGARVMGDERILGGSDFVESVLSEAEEAFERKSMTVARGWDLAFLVDAVAARLGLEAGRIGSSSRAREVARGRSIVCCLAVDMLTMSGFEVARRLHLSPSAVSKLATRGRRDPMTATIKDELVSTVAQ
jgi:REP-associated tyrosine transposase